MSSRAFACLVLACAASALRASSSDAVIVAAMRLSDQPNYRWVTRVVDDARTYEIHGQTMSDGYSHVRMPMVNTVRRRLGRSATDTDIEAIFRGNVRCVLATDDGWKTVDELPEPIEPPPSETGGSLAMGGLLGIHPAPRPKPKPDAYSNLQLGICPPHEELGVIVTSHVNLHVKGDVATGELTNLGAQLLLVRDGQKQITPLQAAGTFKLWLRDGFVTRYQIDLDGILSVDTESGRLRVRVQQTTDTMVKSIGAAKFEVPAEARRKLGT